MPLPAFADPVFPTIPMAVTLPRRDRERLIRTLAASAIRRPLSPADLRFPDATENGFARTLAPSTHLQTHPRRPELPPRDRKRLAHPLAASAIRRPLSLADLRFPARPKTARPRSCRVCPSQTRSPSTCASPCDREQIAHTLAASAIRRPSSPPTSASRTRPRTFPRAVSRKRRATACALPAWLWLSRRAMWGKKCSSFTIR